MDINLLHGDCLELMKDIPDKSINLIVTDPPYNIGKAKWDKIPNYIDWMGAVFLECQRVLKDNGSFYWFHNDMMQIKDLMRWIEDNTQFVFKQFIVWNKRFPEAGNKGFLDGFIVVDGLRNYQQMAEYCLFYTFQDDTGLSKIFNDKDCFFSIKKYMRDERAKTGLTLDGINEVVGTASMAGRHYFSDSQWRFPIKEHYEKLQTTGFFRREYEELRREYEELRREYEELRREYEELRREYESLRYTFNNQKTHHSVWNYETAPKLGHITPKPVEMIENIILHSSNEGDIVLDPFIGSGTTAISALNTGRYFIGIEKEKEYVDIANKRIEEHQEKAIGTLI